MSSWLFLALLLALSIIAAAVQRLQIRSRRRQLRALASQWGMHYSSGDQFRLAARIAPRLPCPGAADVRVRDLIYGQQDKCFHYVFTAAYTIGALRMKLRRRLVVALSEPSGRGSRQRPDIDMRIAPAEIPLVEQYNKVKSSDRASPRAFSLVELLVVIGIIALLISILMPALHKARAQALSVNCQSNLRTIGQAMLMYANENRGWLFPPENGLIVPVNQRWFIYVLKPTPPLDPNSTQERDWTPPLMRCPADDPEPTYFHSYLVNHHLCEHHILYSTKPPAGITSSRAVVMGEKMTQSTNYYVEILNGQSTYDPQVEKYRHGRALGSNYLYLDLHVDRDGPVTTTYGADPWDFPDSSATTAPQPNQ